jgi:hypothetical protein
VAEAEVMCKLADRQSVSAGEASAAVEPAP